MPLLPDRLSARKFRQPWWPIAVAVAVALTLAGCSAHAPRSDEGHHDESTAVSADPSRLPLDRELVPGWRITTVELGLPQGVWAGKMFAGTGDAAYFVTNGCLDCTGEPAEWKYGAWVYGIDTRTGARLFAPVALAGYRGPSPVACHRNGSAVAVCISDEPRDNSLWVLDLSRGAVTFTGPAELPDVTPLGTRLVVAKRDGVYGIGSHGELSWHAPGSGEMFVHPELGPADEDSAPDIAVQFAPEADPAYRVFSLADGHDLTPVAPAGTALKRAVVYRGGFAYQFQDGDGSAGVLFYDIAGHLLHRLPVDHYNLWPDPVLPTILDPPNLRLYTAVGGPVITVPAYQQRPDVRVIGNKAYVWRGPGPAAGAPIWEQWDLKTGARGPSCGVWLHDNAGSDGYVTSDGRFVLRIWDNGRNLVATDLSTCRDSWTLNLESAGKAWRVPSGVVVATPDGVELLQPSD